MRWIKSLAGVPAPAGGAHILYSVTRYPCQPLRERIFWTTYRRLLFDFATALDASNIGTPGSLAVVFSVGATGGRSPKNTSREPQKSAE
jgi:hypothetical protein